MRSATARLLAIVLCVAAGSAGCSAQPFTFGDGFYAEEPSLDGSTFRWMSESGSIALQPGTSDMVLELAFDVPLDQLAAPPTVTISLNGAPLERIAVTDKAFTRRYEVPQASQTPGTNLQLRIQTSETFVPRERDSASADARRLGLIVSRVEWRAK